VLYLSRQVVGQWQIERWQTADGGATWSQRSLTAGSLEKNVRPVVARGGGPWVASTKLWPEWVCPLCWRETGIQPGDPMPRNSARRQRCARCTV
jgi:hypothetical protein